MSKVLVDRELLEQLQEKLDPHRDAVLWGDVCDALRRAQPAEAEVVVTKIECTTCRGTGSLEFEGGAVVKDCAPCKGTGRDLKAERYALAARLSEAIAALSAVTAERDALAARLGEWERSKLAQIMRENVELTAERDRLAAALSAPDKIKAEPAGDYANLRKQFMSLNALANSNAKMVKYWRDQCGHETRETLLANAANVNAERDTNALLTDSLEAAEAERDQLRAELEALRALLSKSLPVVEAHAGASHMLEGFRPIRNKWDELVDGIRAAMAAKEA